MNGVGCLDIGCLAEGTVMANKLNAFEILEIAEQMERNAVSFYREAARFFDEPKLHKLMFELADWEKEHEETFAKMRREVSEELNPLEDFDPYEYMPANPQVLDGLALSVFKPNPMGEITGKETKEQLLRKALKKEEDTIVFFRGLARFARDLAAEHGIVEIIKEEEHHIRIIRESLDQL
jgi:rubrerythrin